MTNKRLCGFLFAFCLICAGAAADDSDVFFDDSFGEPGEGVSAAADPLNSEVPSTPPTDESVPQSAPSASKTAEVPQNEETGESAASETVPDNAATDETPSQEGIELIKTLLTLPESAKAGLTGKQTSLADVLVSVTQPDQRKQVTETYWELTEKLALYHLSLIYANDIEDCISRFTKEGNLSQSETAVLLSARRRAEQRVSEAKITFNEAQHKLAGITANRGGSSYAANLPIPSDLPNTLAYKTRYDRIKQEKKLSAGAAYLNEAIPTRFEIVQLYDQAVNDAFESYKKLYFTLGTSAEILLSAADRLVEAKENLIRSVTAYNQLIAAYVAETVGPEVRGTRLLTTMIRVPNTGAVPLRDSGRETRIAASQIPETAPQRRPAPKSAEIPPFLSPQKQGQQIIRPGQKAELLK